MSRVNESYLGNQNLKRSNVKHSWTPQQVQEWLKSAQDPEYFIETYIKIVNVDKGLVNFDLYSYQKDIVKCRGNVEKQPHWLVLCYGMFFSMKHTALQSLLIN